MNACLSVDEKLKRHSQTAKRPKKEAAAVLVTSLGDSREVAPVGHIYHLHWTLRVRLLVLTACYYTGQETRRAWLAPTVLVL